MGKKSTVFLAIIIVLIVIFFGLSVYKKLLANDSEETIENVTEADVIARIVEKNEFDSLRGMTERDRIDYYFSTFIKAIEAGKYNEAYSKLADSFKANYFLTEEEFENYAKVYFPKNISVNYTNIERNGNTYIIYTNLGNLIGVDKSSVKEFRAVIRENGLNDYEMSFSVNTDLNNYLKTNTLTMDVPAPVVENTTPSEETNNVVENVVDSVVENVIENTL